MYIILLLIGQRGLVACQKVYMVRVCGPNVYGLGRPSSIYSREACTARICPALRLNFQVKLHKATSLNPSSNAPPSTP